MYGDILEVRGSSALDATALTWPAKREAPQSFDEVRHSIDVGVVAYPTPWLLPVSLQLSTRLYFEADERI